MSIVLNKKKKKRREFIILIVIIIIKQIVKISYVYIHTRALTNKWKIMAWLHKFIIIIIFFDKKWGS